MNENIKILIGILIPFFGTTLGAVPVFFIKRKMSAPLLRILSGFAAGVMIAASVWSLLIPAIEMSDGRFTFIPAVTGFLIGILFLALIDIIISKITDISLKSDTSKSGLMTMIAVTLHNIPEGMAVGIGFAAILSGETHITFPQVLALTTGIAIQNIPEGAIISMPLKTRGVKKGKSFFYGVLSGAVEPLGAAITILLTSVITPMLPYILAFAAGAMIYVVAKELIPEAQQPNGTLSGTLSLGIGFALMMLLDVALG